MATIRLTTSAHCIAMPPCGWVGKTDKDAEKHGREMGHATVTISIPEAGNQGANGTMGAESEAAPGGVCAPFSEGLTPTKEGLMPESSAHPAGGR